MNQAEFVRSVEREYFIVRRICDVLSPDDLAFRPSENQRSIEELLRYLSWCGYESVHQILAGENYEESQFKKTADEFLIEEFPARIGEQADLIRQAIEQLLGEDWQDRKAQYWWGQEGSLPAVLVETTLKWLTAYRMNLFLFAKAAGHSELDRKACWAVSPE